MPLKRTPDQNRRLWVLTGRLDDLIGADEGKARMRQLCKDISGQTSTKELTPAQADLLIEQLKKDVSIIERHKQRQAADPDDLPTKEQLATIEHLRIDLNISPRGLVSICEKACAGRIWPQTRAEAGKVHEALTAILARQKKRKPGELWLNIDAMLKLPSLTKWERDFLTDVRRRLDTNRRIPAGAWPKLQEIESKTGIGNG